MGNAITLHHLKAEPKSATDKIKDSVKSKPHLPRAKSIRAKQILRIPTKYIKTTSSSERTATEPVALDPSGGHNIEPEQNVIIDGRRYQALNTRYALPNDLEEQDRLIQAHFMLKRCFSGNFSAPVHDLLSQTLTVSWDASNGNDEERRCSADTQLSSATKRTTSTHTNWVRRTEPAYVLDVACGTGVWVLEMATDYPITQFYGIDLSVQYPLDIKPANAHFIQADVTQGLPFEDSHFDYIHMRMTYKCFSRDEWTIIVKEIRRVLKPGGYVEFREVDPIMKSVGPTGKKLLAPFAEAFLKGYGVDVNWAQYMCDYLCDVGGMTDIHHDIISVGFPTEGPEGALIEKVIRLTFQSYGKIFAEACHFPKDQFYRDIDQLMKEVYEYKSYYNYYLAWARKPLIEDNHSSLHRLISTENPKRPIPRRWPLSSDLSITSIIDGVTIPTQSEPNLVEDPAYAEQDILHFAHGFEE
ncbi:uncharacterized protein BYT42DRAFT_555350 [Radiomyces spectabilis]|uniref:uncharacterized protein n=1 Tax=Radiomyces spectabilis TaxID=64574 RepID=UPI00221EDC7F|nr:uncharacterized protein BYT42DRAFT_555350 [Radiomyces spectabilis]KAI8391036.1 hypothetical protein BYT42DRAFT_555350 [Radiomyces spectabilis]